MPELSGESINTWLGILRLLRRNVGTVSSSSRVSSISDARLVRLLTVVGRLSLEALELILGYKAWSEELGACRLRLSSRCAIARIGCCFCDAVVGLSLASSILAFFWIVVGRLRGGSLQVLMLGRGFPLSMARRGL